MAPYATVEGGQYNRSCSLQEEVEVVSTDTASQWLPINARSPWKHGMATKALIISDANLIIMGSRYATR